MTINIINSFSYLTTSTERNETGKKFTIITFFFSKSLLIYMSKAINTLSLPTASDEARK